jgi:predicted unusual protein kinase regulating ubiquinone biosynthesis (AarF/ABC1/UbiB family)
LADVALSLSRAAPSARIAIVRAGGILAPEALPAELRETVEQEVAAARAQTCVALRPAEVERILRTAWGRRPADVLDELDPEPLGIAPAAQVHRGVLDGAEVAIKVRRPGVERGVRSDLALLDGLAGPLRAAFPRLDAGAVLRDVRALALDELDLEHEGSQQRRVARALRSVPGVAVPRPHSELAAEDVLVSDLLEGATLAAGARVPDRAAATRALAGAFRAAVLGAGLVPYDPRASHVVVAPDGTLGLLGMGVARAIDRDRAAIALAGLEALAGDDEDAFATAVAGDAQLLSEADARAAHALLRTVLGELLEPDPAVDDAALRTLAQRVQAAAPDVAALATRAAARPEDLVLARMVGQVAALISRL